MTSGDACPGTAKRPRRTSSLRATHTSNIKAAALLRPYGALKCLIPTLSTARTLKRLGGVKHFALPPDQSRKERICQRWENGWCAVLLATLFTCKSTQTNPVVKRETNLAFNKQTNPAFIRQTNPAFMYPFRIMLEVRAERV